MNKETDLQSKIEGINLKSLEKKTVTSTGAKTAAVPVNLFSALRKPWENFQAQRKKIKAAFATEEPVITDSQELKRINAEIEEELTNNVKIEADKKINNPLDSLELKSKSDNNILETTNSDTNTLETSNSDTNTLETNTEVSVQDLPKPILTPEPVVAPLKIDNSGLSIDMHIKSLELEEIAIETQLKSYKSKPSADTYDDVVDLNDRLDEVKRQLDAAIAQREIQEKVNDLNFDVSQEPVQEEKQAPNSIRETVINSLTGFLTNEVKDRQEHNEEIDIQIAMLMERKAKNNTIIAQYETYIASSLITKSEQAALQSSDDSAFEKALLLSKINDVKVKLRDAAYDEADSLRIELSYLEGVLAGFNNNDELNADNGFQKTK